MSVLYLYPIPFMLTHPWQLVLFDVIPTFIDIIVALVVFAIKLDWTLTVITSFVVFAYGAWRIFGDVRTPPQLHVVVASVLLTQRRTRLRRAMNDRDAVRQSFSSQSRRFES